MDPVVLQLPFPPTTNNLFLNAGKRRVPTKAYDAWRARAGHTLLSQKPRRITGRYSAVMTFERPDRRARDVGNYEKAVSDLLVSCGVVEDDHLCQRIVLEWSEAESPARDAQVTIILREHQ